MSNTENKTKKKDLYKKVFLIYIPLGFWVLLSLYTEILLNFESMCLKKVISQIGLSLAVFSTLDLTIELVNDVLPEYIKSIHYNSERKMDLSDKTCFGLILLGTFTLGLIKVFFLPWLYDSHLSRYLKTSYNKASFEDLRSIKSQDYFSWALLVGMFLITYVMVKLKSFCSSLVETTLFRRIDLGVNQALNTSGVDKKQELYYRQTFENIRIIFSRALLILTAYLLYNYGGYIYHEMFLLTDLKWSSAYILVGPIAFFSLGPILLHSHKKVTKPENYDYNFLKDFSLSTILNSACFTLKKFGQAIVKKLKRAYTNHYEEIKKPTLFFCAMLCMHMHVFSGIVMKRLYELNFTRQNLEGLTIQEIFSPQTFFSNVGSAYDTTRYLVVYLLFFQILSYIKDLFIDSKTDISTILDMCLYFFFVAIVLSYYLALELYPASNAIFSSYGISLSLIRSLFVSANVYYRLNSYRLYIRTLFDKRSVEVISTWGLGFTAIALFLKRILEIHLYAVLIYVTHVSLSLYVFKEIYKKRKNKDFEQLGL